MSDVAKEWALTIGSDLASMQSDIARCLSMTMQAASHGQPGVLESATKEAETIREQADTLITSLRNMHKVMTS